MSSSGLIYAVIVGAWAAYLVPMWLRRQDELNDARPTERFTTAIRMLTGRAAAERRQAKERGTGDAPADEQPDGGHDPDPRPVADSAPLPPQERAARAQVLARRRRTTMVLFLAFTLGAVLAAVAGLRYLWAPAIPALLLTAYVLYLRTHERRRYAVRLDQHRAEAAARQLHDRRRAVAPTAVDPGARPTPAPEPATPPPTPAPTPSDDRRALVEETDHAEWVDQQRERRSSGETDGWDPVPVPLPTYVNAPVAPRSASGVDLGAPDTWSSARSATAEPTPPPTPAAAPAPAPAPAPARPRGRTPLFDQYADEDRPRAANE
ncbi:hypothetical protein V1J52_15065 [Streptomyces sp. TRM 70351]|uniref:divisome protein SepX/GlpR n=1 Tax=Streptomyces sp. TRM 70351 TaxID=3116552 RepID=UPI002E7AF7B9|nr:hypothetical protein [Streptomyces sp. TRM 70351]MEE1929487.1 hypothetical protein [Streptomyces sp. TRM 70351]